MKLSIANHYFGIKKAVNEKRIHQNHKKIFRYQKFPVKRREKSLPYSLLFFTMKTTLSPLFIPPPPKKAYSHLLNRFHKLNLESSSPFYDCISNIPNLLCETMQCGSLCSLFEIEASK